MLSTAQVEAQVPARGRLDRDLQLPLPGLEDDSDSCDSDSCFMLHRRNPRTGPKTVIWLRETCHDRRCGMKPLCY